MDDHWLATFERIYNLALKGS